MLSSEILAVAYGLVSGVAWGAGDFTGGMATRRQPVYSVILYVQIIGGAILISTALLLGVEPPTARQLIMGGLAGVCGTGGMAALYLALAFGRIGIVAPLSAVTAAMLPIIFGACTEGLPEMVNLAGFGAALAAVWLLCYQKGQGRTDIKTLGLPLAAGLGVGLFYVFIGQVSRESAMWPVASARVVSVLLMAGYFACKGGLKPVKGGGQWSLIVLTGVLETGGSVLFALAAGTGRLDISAVLSSLYPATTVLLAGMVLKEKLSARHWAGVAAAMAALVLISL